MNIPNEHDGGNPSGAALQDSEAPETVKRDKLEPITPVEFFPPLAIDMPGTTQAIVTTTRGDTPNDHNWSKLKIKGDRARWLAERAAGRKPAYFSMAAFDSDKVFQYEGRTKLNVRFVTSFWIDIEACADKYARNPNGGYPGGKAALIAVSDFCKAAGLFLPNFIVLTGSGGMHMHFVLDAPIAPGVWEGRARALVALAKIHSFKIDAQVTTDAARIMRAPGSLHQKTGKPVQAYRWRVKPYSLEEFDAFVKYAPGAVDVKAIPAAVVGKFVLSVNGDALVDYPAFSYVQAGQRCGAMNRAAQNAGTDTPYPVWMLAVKTAALSIEGRDYAHEVSCGHPDYESGATEKK